MCHCRITILILTFTFLFYATLTTNGQQELPSQEKIQEFLKQYQTALQDGDIQKANRLVRQNRESAHIGAKLLFDKGTNIYYAADYDTALAFLTLSQDLYQQLGDVVGEGKTLNNLGLIYHDIGEYRRALSYYQEALQISKDIEDKAEEARNLHNIGTVYLATGEYQQALVSLQQALTMRRKIGNLSGEATTLNSIGALYLAIGEYQLSLTHLQKALEIRREIGDRAGENTSLNNIGAVYEATGEFQQALSYYEDALNMSREIRDKAGEGATLNNIGQIYRKIGDYQQALTYYFNSLEIKREIGDKDGEGTTLHNIGGLYQSIGDYQRALSYLEDALKTRREIGDKDGEGTTLHSIGKIYTNIGNYKRALEYLQNALNIGREIGDKPGEATTLNSIGLTYQSTGDNQKALNYYQEALKINNEIGDTPGIAANLNNIGTIYRNTDDYQKALSYYQDALNVSKEIGAKAEEGKILTNIGYLHEQKEEREESLANYKRAIELLEEIRDKAGETGAKESFFTQQLYVYARTVNLLIKLNAFEEAFAYAERSKARSFLDQLYEASTGIKQSITPQLIEEEANLYNKLFAIEQSLKKKLTNKRRRQLLEDQKHLEHELSVIKQKLRTSSPRYAELKYPQPATVDKIQQEILKERDVLVEYFPKKDGVYVFIIGKTEIYIHTLTVDSERVMSNIREAMNRKVAYELYQLLFQPLEQKIAEASQGKEIKNLIIIPDGVLFYLPFEMLVTKDGETPEYLVDRYTISYAPSASVLKPEILRARQPEQYGQDLLALAPFGEAETTTAQIAMKATEDLLLSDTLRSGLEGVQPLPYSAGEVQTISRLYPQSVFKIGADATKAYFKDHTKGNRYLHLSTHGYLDHEHAMYSGLLFSDGMLQTYEIFNLDIDAELTVLSACQTGLGELKAGEGLVGLTRAFMYAGSPSVLVSLWSVSDPSTAAFMKRFYRNLNKGMTKAKALRETKIWMKEKSYHTDEHGNVIKHDDPFYWAPFILVGAYN